MIVTLINQFPNQLIVEVIDADVPKIDLSTLEYYVPWHIANDNNTSKRTSVKPSLELERVFSPVYEFLNPLLSNHIFPLMGNDTRFPPFIETIQNGENRFMICRDEAGWFQEVHCDLGRLVISGVIHITDTDSPTKFYNNQEKEILLYTAPCKAGSGAFWLNLKDSWHEVPAGTKERNHIITFVGPPEPNRKLK